MSVVFSEGANGRVEEERGGFGGGSEMGVG